LGNSTGEAKIEFCNREDAVKAIKEYNGYIS
jgi:RNA recognition motif-containing protein